MRDRLRKAPAPGAETEDEAIIIRIRKDLEEAARSERNRRKASEDLAKPEARLGGAGGRSDVEESMSSALEFAELRDRDQNRDLRKSVAYCAIGFVGFQLLALDLTFAWYLVETRFQVASQVIIAWMSASVIEIIGILWVVARNLFPFNDKFRDKQLER